MSGSRRKARKRVLVVLEEGTLYSQRLMEGALRYVDQHPEIELQEWDYPRFRVPKWLKHPLNFDGLLLWVGADERWVDQLLQTGLPAVNTSAGWPLERLPMVSFRGGDLVRRAVDHLGTPERRTLAMVRHGHQDEAVWQIYAAFFNKLATNKGKQTAIFNPGQQPGLERHPPHLTHLGEQHLRAFLKQLTLPAGIWATTDPMGQMVIDAAHDLGLRIPDQLAILGMGDYALARQCRPPLSSIPQPGDLIAFEAMRILDNLMAGRAPVHPLTELPTPPVVERVSTRGTDTTDNPFETAHAFILEHACQGIKANDVLRTVPVSMPTLHRAFMTRCGRTPGAEIRRVKMERAQYYLRTTSLSITHIADLCGYNEHSKFCNFFKRETGLTPSQYRDSNSPQKPK